MTANRKRILIPGALLAAVLAGPAAAADAGPAGPLFIGAGQVPVAGRAGDPGEIFGLDLTPDDCAETHLANQALGGLLGGVVGGLIGSGIGKGGGNTAATIGGAVLGALGGATLGTRVAEAGEACLPEPDAGAAWANPDAAATTGAPVRLTGR